METTKNYGFNVLTNPPENYPDLSVTGNWQKAITDNFNRLDGLLRQLTMPSDDELRALVTEYLNAHPELLIQTLASETKNGLMSIDLFKKLSGVEEKANNYKLPAAGLNRLGGIKTTSSIKSKTGLTPLVIIDGEAYYTDCSDEVRKHDTQLGGLSFSIQDGGLVVTYGEEVSSYA